MVKIKDIERTALVILVFCLTAPYDPHLSSRESVVKAFWVQSGGVGSSQSPVSPLPMAINFNIQQSGLLTEDLLTEMVCYCLLHG